MPLSEHDKSEARDAIALALALNEPETMIEGLKRLCARQIALWTERRESPAVSDNERERWQTALDALIDVQRELERANAPHKRQVDAQPAQSNTQPDC